MVQTPGNRPAGGPAYTGPMPSPGDKVRLIRHGHQVTAVVQPYWEPYCRFHRSLPVACCCGCCRTTIADLGEVTYLGSGPPS